MVSKAALAIEPADAPAHTVVSYKAQDLNSTAGVAGLYGRINRAAQEGCGAWDSFGQALSPLTQSCINEAVSHAVAQVNSPMLTSFYSAKTGKADKREAILARAR